MEMWSNCSEANRSALESYQFSQEYVPDDCFQEHQAMYICSVSDQ